MKGFPSLLFFLFTLFFFLVACQQKPPQPEDQYQNLKLIFHPVFVSDKEHQVEDLDRDGRTEVICLNYEAKTPFFIIYNANMDLVLQEPLPDNYRFKQAFDVNGDGIKELIFSRFNKKEDYLWLIYDWKKEIFEEYLILSRDPRIPLERGWNFNFEPFYLYDADHDGREEIIGILDTGYGKYPRGIGAYDLVDQKFIWKFEMGTSPIGGVPPVVANIDQDSNPEILLVTGAVKNGAVANGLDDFHSYFLAIDMETQQLDYKEVLGDKHTNSDLKQIEALDGSKYFVVNVHSNEVRGKNYFRIYDGRLNVVREKQFDLRLNSNFYLTDFNGDGQQDIVISSRDKRVLVLNQQLETILEKEFPFFIFNIVQMVDYNRDGRSEFLLQFLNKDVLLLDQSLDPLAFLKGAKNVAVFDDGVSNELKFAVYDGKKFSLNQLQFNWQFIPWYVYALPLLAIIILLAIFIIRLVRVIRFHRLLNRYVAFNQNKGIVIFNRKGRISLINQYVQEHISNAQHDTIQEFIADFQNKPALSEIGDFVKESWVALSEDESAKDSMDQNISSGDMHYKLRLSTIKQGRKTAAFLLEVEDISQIIFSERARSRVAIMRSIAHDIKQPLTNILITMDKLRYRYQDLQIPHQEEFVQYANLVKNETRNVNEIIRNLLEFADLEKPRKTLANLGELICKLHNEYIQLLPTHVAINLDGDKSVPDFYFDPRQVERALRNVINNAVAAICERGEINISLHLAPKLKEKDVAYVSVKIRDNGCGIPQEHLKKVFEPYFTTKPTGTGLGMSIVYEIMEKHQGTVNINSKVNEGTTVELLFPVVTALEDDHV